MFNELHDFAKEYPEFKDRIHQLKLSDKHFARTYLEYEDVAHELLRIEQEIETPSDEYVEILKKKRLKLKDSMMSRLQYEAA